MRLSRRDVLSGWQSEEAAWVVGFVPCALSTGCVEHVVAKANGMAGGSMRARYQRTGERIGLSRWSDWMTRRLGVTQADGYARAMEEGGGDWSLWRLWRDAVRRMHA
jgi:hypothetical protein